MKKNRGPSAAFARVALIGLVIAYGGVAHAAPFTWDASGGDPLDDGSGAWNATGGTNWFNGTTYGAWGNTSADTATFGVGSGAAGTITVGNVTVNAITFNAAGSGNYTLSSGTLTMAGTTPTMTVNASGTTTIASIVAGTDLTKSGAGTLTLSGANTYTGVTTLSSGTINVGSLSNLGVNGSLGNRSADGAGVGILFRGGVLQYTGSTAQETNRSIRVGPEGATLDASGSVPEATMSFTRATSTNLFDTAGARTFTFTGSNTGNNTFAMAITNQAGNATSVVKSGPGKWVLTGTNSYGGVTTISGGVLGVASLSDYGVNGSLGNRAAGGDGTFNVGILFRGGVLQYTGSTAQTTNRAIRIGTSGATLDASGSVPEATMNFTATSSPDLFDAAGARAITFTGSNNGDNTFAMAITNQAGNGTSVVKSGNGTWKLSGASSYSGGTTISAGRLALGSTSALGTGTVTFTGNATLRPDVTGTYSVPLTVNSGMTATIDAAIDVTLSGRATGAGGSLTKAGAGKLTLSASNSYTGSTAVSGGTLEFNSIDALRNSSGVSIAGGAGLAYAGGAATFNRNITVTSGTGTVTNSGAGVLTLSGTLSKDNSVLRLTGGSFNVTGVITGATPGKSDFFVDGASVTFSNANTYDGPTNIYNGGTLTLAANNAIPSNSVVTVGDFSSTGTLDASTLSSAIGGLAFGSSGGTLRVAATSTSAASLTAAAGTMTLTNGTLNLAGSGSTAGLYRVLAAQSIVGSFASITGASAAYQLILSNTAIDYQRRAEIGTITATPAAASIITGGSTAFTFTVQNSTPTGGASLAPAFSAGSNVDGSASLASVTAASTSGSVSGFVFTGTSVGTGRTGLFTVNDSNAIAATGTGSVSVNVYGHAAPTLTSGTLPLGNIHLGYGSPGTSSNSLSAANGSGGDYIVALKGSSSAASGNVSLNAIAGVAAGNSGSVSATLATGRSVGAINESFIYTFADDSNLSGASSNVGTATIAVTGNVYSGQSTWATNGNGNWGTLVGTGANAFGSNWGTNQGSPGLDAEFNSTDTAMFGSALLSGTAVINTAGANISLKSLTFDNANGSYQINQTGGSGSLTLLAAGANAAGITVAAGSHTIHADVTLGSSTTIDVASDAAFTLHNAVSGDAAFGLTKAGLGTLYFNGNNTFAGVTQIDSGAMIVNGSLVGDVVVADGALLGGSGVLGDRLSGAGTISVGNSPGIGTAASVDPSLGTDWIFEITGPAPIWNAGTSASINDVLRLTDATPFLSSLATGNVLDVLFNLTTDGPIAEGTYLGGVFIDNEAYDLLAALARGTFQYWVAGAYGDVADRKSFNVGSGGTAVTYTLLSAYDSSLTASYSVTQLSVNFGDGQVTGAVTQFVIVPEPGTAVFAGIGIAMAGWSLWKRRRTT